MTPNQQCGVIINVKKMTILFPFDDITYIKHLQAA